MESRWIWHHQWEGWILFTIIRTLLTINDQGSIPFPLQARDFPPTTRYARVTGGTSKKDLATTSCPAQEAFVPQIWDGPFPTRRNQVHSLGEYFHPFNNSRDQWEPQINQEEQNNTTKSLKIELLLKPQPTKTG